MKWLVPFVLTFVCLPLGFTQEVQPVPELNGYVTRGGSATGFDVNGWRVICSPKTEFKVRALMEPRPLPWVETPYIGMALEVFGRKDRKRQTILARQVIKLEAGEPAKVKGFGVIDRILPPPSSSRPDSILVRVDGYPVLVNGKTNSTFITPLKSVADVGPNVWLAFHGEQRSDDDAIVADKAVFVENEVGAGESKLRGKSEYDPAAVDPHAKQNVLRETFVGWDPKKAPPYENAQMQARVDRIGSSLIPEYQRALPSSDPTKIALRFQLIDEKHFKDALALPSGIILVPHQVVERMQNDSQLAAVLADNIATVVTKQSLRSLAGDRAMRVAAIASIALSTAGIVAVGITESARIRRQEEESARVALGLMADAKYDVDQAPIAWWLLASKSPKPIGEIELPERAAYQLQILGTYWRPESLFKKWN